MTQKRSAIRARTRYERVDDFIEGYGRFFGRRSIFLRTRSDKEPGTVLRFEIQLADGRPIFRGEGVVVPPMEGDEGEQGLRIRFSKLDRTSKDLLDEIRDSARSRAKARAASRGVPGRGESALAAGERPDDDLADEGEDGDGDDHIVEEFDAAIDFLEPHDLDEQTGRRRAALLQAIARPHEPLDRPPSGAFSLSPADIDQIAGSLALDFDMMFETTDVAADDVLFDHHLGIEMSRELPRVLTGEYAAPSIFGDDEGPEPDPELVEAVDSALDDVLGGFGGGFFAEPSGRVSSTRILVPEAVAEATSLYEKAEAVVETHEAPPPVIAPLATHHAREEVEDDEEEILDVDGLLDDDEGEGDDEGASDADAEADADGIEELHPAHYPTETEQGGYPTAETSLLGGSARGPAPEDEAAFHEAAFLAAMADDEDEEDDELGDGETPAEGADDPFAAMLQRGASAPYLSVDDEDAEDDDLGLFGGDDDDETGEEQELGAVEERPPHLDFGPEEAEDEDDFFVQDYEGPAPGPDDPTPVPFSARQMVFTGSHRGPDGDLDLAAYTAEAFEEAADADALAEEEALEEPLHGALDDDYDYGVYEDAVHEADTYEPPAPPLSAYDDLDDDEDDAPFDEAAGFDAEDPQPESAPIAAPGWSADLARAKTPSYAHEAVTRVAVGPSAPPEFESPADTDSDLLPEPVPPAFDDDSDPYYDDEESDAGDAAVLPSPAPGPRFPPSLRGAQQRAQQFVINEQQTVPRRDYSEELAAISRAESGRPADRGPTIADLMRTAGGDDDIFASGRGGASPPAGEDDDLAVTFFLEEGTSVISPHDAPPMAAPDDFQAAQLAALEADLEENPDEPAIAPTEAETGPAGPWTSRRDAAYDDLPPTDDEDDWLERVNRARDSLASLQGGASYEPAIDDSLGDLALAAASNYDAGEDYDLGEDYGDATQGVYHHIADGEGVESGYRGFDQREVSEVLELGPDALIDNDELSLEEEFSLELVENGGLGDDELVLENGPMAESHFAGMRGGGGQLSESEESESIASLLAEMMSDTPRSDSGRVELPLDLDDDDFSPPRGR
jgi:hypothetical protein